MNAMQAEEAAAEAERKRQEEEEIKAHRKTLQFKVSPLGGSCWS